MAGRRRGRGGKEGREGVESLLLQTYVGRRVDAKETGLWRMVTGFELKKVKAEV